MSNVTIGGKVYSTGKLDTFTQLHLARKLGPSIPIIEGLIDPENAGKDKSILSVLMLSHLSDADSDFVIKKCLSVVYRKETEGDRPAKIQSPEGAMMFDDITLAAMLELTIVVIEENLGDFFRTALAGIPAHAGV